jgi:hypothetical protein
MSKTKIPFQPGEIVTGRRDITPVSVGKRMFRCNNGQSIRATCYSVPQLRGSFPFLRGLLRKRFMVFFDEYDFNKGIPHEMIVRDYTRIVLLDDYKPDIYGRNYIIYPNSFDLFETTGAIVRDYRKMPFPIQKKALSSMKRDKIDNGYISFDGKDLIERFRFHRKIQFRIFDGDLYTTYAKINVLKKNCRECGYPLMKNDVKVIDLLSNNIDFKKVKKVVMSILGISADYDREKVLLAIFPVGFTCPNCTCLNVLTSHCVDSFDFTPLSMGDVSNFVT